jgi:predicted ATPase
LITLVGPPGVGKTHLAQQVLHASAPYFADGVCDLSLAEISNPDHVGMAIVNTLKIIPGAYETPAQCLANHLKGQHLLLMVDTFEHLLPAAPLLADVLVAAPHVKLLVTSRTALHLAGELVFTVQPLAVPDLAHLPPLDELARVPAVALYLARAQAVNQAFRLTRENASAVATLCVQLDGLPLAIELAAARSKLFSPAALLARFTGVQAAAPGESLHLLAHGPRNVPERHQSLANAIRWSYELLNKTEQTVFAQLALYARGCTLATAEQICGRPDAEATLLDSLATLVDHHLLQVESEPNSDPRFYMLETIRVFALAHLNAQGQRPASL